MPIFLTCLYRTTFCKLSQRPPSRNPPQKSSLAGVYQRCSRGNDNPVCVYRECYGADSLLTLRKPDVEAIILIANNNGAGMKGVRHPLLPRGECCCYLPPTTGGPCLQTTLFPPGPQAGQPRRGAVWPPGRGVPRGPAAPALARWPSARRGGTGSPSLAPRTWPHPGPLGRERPGKGQDGGG